LAVDVTHGSKYIPSHVSYGVLIPAPLDYRKGDARPFETSIYGSTL